MTKSDLIEALRLLEFTDTEGMNVAQLTAKLEALEAADELLDDDEGEALNEPIEQNDDELVKDIPAVNDGKVTIISLLGFTNEYYEVSAEKPGVALRVTAKAAAYLVEDDRTCRYE